MVLRTLFCKSRWMGKWMSWNRRRYGWCHDEWADLCELTGDQALPQSVNSHVRSAVERLHQSQLIELALSLLTAAAWQTEITRKWSPEGGLKVEAGGRRSCPVGPLFQSPGYTLKFEARHDLEDYLQMFWLESNGLCAVALLGSVISSGGAGWAQSAKLNFNPAIWCAWCRAVSLTEVEITGVFRRRLLFPGSFGTSRA